MCRETLYSSSSLLAVGFVCVFCLIVSFFLLVVVFG